MQVEIASQEVPYLDEWLMAQRYDLGLTERAEVPGGTSASCLLETQEVRVLPNGHPLLEKAAIDLADLHGEAFINLSAQDPYRLSIDSVLGQLGIAPRPVVETSTAVSVCAFVQQGIGLAIVNPLTALFMAGEHLHVRPLTYAFPYRVFLIRPEHRPSNCHADEFVQSLADEVRELLNRLTTLSAIRARLCGWSASVCCRHHYRHPRAAITRPTRVVYGSSPGERARCA